MPARRNEREGNASSDASIPPAPEALALPTTRSGLVRQMPVTLAFQGNDTGGENGMLPPHGASQGFVLPPPKYQQILRANTELIVQCKRMSEAYEKNVEAITAESALYRKELEESRKEVNDLQKEIASLKELIQSLALSGPTTVPSTQVSSPGRAWASVVSQSSVASSNTRATRAGLGLPAVVLDVRFANDVTKALVDDSARTREKIRAVLKDGTTTTSVDVVGVKPTSRTTVKVFVDSEDSVASLRRDTHWLNALPRAKLQGEQWYPVKLNDVKKESVFDTSGTQREDFTRIFQEENEAAQIKKIIWLSRKKRYGSMAIYFSSQPDAESMLNRRIVHVRGEASFSDRFYERRRPLRCHKCQQYNHKEDRCPNPEACSKCAGNHRFDQCTSERIKCAACQGDHAANDRSYPKWDEEWKVIRRREQEMAAKRSDPRPNGSQ